jgi:hypothetical protein
MNKSGIFLAVYLMHAEVRFISNSGTYSPLAALGGSIPLGQLVSGNIRDRDFLT